MSYPPGPPAPPERRPEHTDDSSTCPACQAPAASNERMDWLCDLVAQCKMEAERVRKAEGTAGQLGAFWAGYAIALGDMQMRALLNLHGLT